MNTKTYETYQGDVVCSRDKNLNTNHKVTRAISAVSQNVSMLNQVSLGHCYADIALVMRESMLLSKMLSTSEVWYDIPKDQYTIQYTKTNDWNK